jgi:hypothetical protein
VAIQYRKKSGGWAIVAPGRVGRHDRFHFFLRGVTRAVYDLAILIDASRVSAAARIPIGTVHVG